jgi:hypothetical protein
MTHTHTTQHLALLDDLVGLFEWVDGLNEERLQLLVVVLGVVLQLEQRVLLAEMGICKTPHARQSTRPRLTFPLSQGNEQRRTGKPLVKRAWR